MYQPGDFLINCAAHHHDVLILDVVDNEMIYLVIDKSGNIKQLTTTNRNQDFHWLNAKCIKGT